ncbi:MAG TPA: threonine synthase [Alphaproteobacteria bacterium]|nr:threonine synthase [Alphaproteobacteria bacterium]
MIRYASTRGETGHTASFSETLMTGLAPDGGLYVPSHWPHVTPTELTDLRGASYADLAAQVMGPFLDESFPSADFADILRKVYAPGHFRHAALAPLVQIGPNEWILELFHGPTLAFKDYALQLLGALFDHALARSGRKMTIVGATSGDTGSAAIEACRTCRNVTIFILHPKGRVSEVQRRQMTTVDAPNVFNIALEGTFDDCQAIVKALFADAALREKVGLSAVNSINWARIAAQIVYYFAAALSLGAPARPVRFAVPTGNFGNVYAAWCAKTMGLPVEGLVIGTNRNDILTRFFETGEMRPETVTPTLSPSMDIQISSNFERYLFERAGRDPSLVREWMETFRTQGRFIVPPEILADARADFSAARCTEKDTLQTIARVHAETGLLIDPHTAVGVHAGRHVRRDPSIPLVSLACAHPAKFPDAVERATGTRPALPDFLAELLGKTERATTLPNNPAAVRDFISATVKN